MKEQIWTTSSGAEWEPRGRMERRVKVESEGWEELMKGRTVSRPGEGWWVGEGMREGEREGEEEG